MRTSYRLAYGRTSYRLAYGDRVRVTGRIDEMERNPLDDEGQPRIEVGDRVRASGSLHRNFFEAREVVAETVVELVD